MVARSIDILTGRDQDPAATGLTKANADLDFKLISGDNVFAVTLAPETDPDDLADLAREHCGARDFCEVLGWIDPKYTAKGFPMTKRELSRLSFQYTVVRLNEMEHVFWDCEIWQRDDTQSCIIRD